MTGIGSAVIGAELYTERRFGPPHAMLSVRCVACHGAFGVLHIEGRLVYCILKSVRYVA